MSDVDFSQEATANNFGFNAIGDYIQGTLVEVDKTTKPDAYGNYSHIYTIKADEGSYHEKTKNEQTNQVTVNEEPTKIDAGDEYNVWVNNSKGPVIGKMKKVQVGQKVKMALTEFKPTDKGNDAKIISVYPGLKDGKPFMDQEWLEMQDGYFDGDQKEDLSEADVAEAQKNF